MNAPLALGFVGLGQIGRPMALRLAGWPGGLSVYDVLPDALPELEAAGAEVAASLAEVGKACDVVSVMVRDDAQVHAVLDEMLPVARPGTVVAVHSTVSPGTIAALAGLAARSDVRLVDAPVSGGAMGAAEGALAIMVGGPPDAYAVCREPFARMASRVVHAGPVGAGTRMKLARNLLHFVAFTAATEAQRLAEAGGLDLVELGAVVRHTDAVTGGPGAIMHRPTAEPMAPGDPWRPIFEHVRALGEKDLAAAVTLAEELGVDVPLARLALERLGAGLGLAGDEQPRPATTEEVR